MASGGNLVRCERYRKTPRTPRSAHARYYYTRSLVIDARSKARQQRSRCQSAPRVMDRSHSRSASPRDTARPQHRPPSPPSPPAFENRAYQHDDYDPNHNDSFNSNGHGHKEPNGDSKTLEAVNLELINLTPKNGHAKKKDVEVDMNASNPYDEYFVPVNEHRKYMRGEKLYVTADKRGEKGGCKRPLCWTLLGLVVAAIVALIVLAATGILFTNSPTPLEPYNASVSSARALGGVTHSTNLGDHDHDHEHDHDHTHSLNNAHDHTEEHTHDTTDHVHEQAGNYNHDHNNSHDYEQKSNTENEQHAEQNHSTDHMNNQEQDSSPEENDNQESSKAVDMVTTVTGNDGAHDHSVTSDETSDSSIYIPRTLEGELKIDNEEFTEELGDPESDEYREFVNTFTEALKRALFDRNTLENGNNDIVLEVVKIRSGSVLVTYRVQWKPKYNMQEADDLLTVKSLESILNNYLTQNNRMISVYHIADDNTYVKPVLDVCQINNNDCENGCEFDERTLEFTCTCPHGFILDMKHPKKCMLLLDNSETNNTMPGDITSINTQNPLSEEKPNNDLTSLGEKEIMHNTFDWKQTSQQMMEVTTESGADVNFSHIFGTADENENEGTEDSKTQSNSSEENNSPITPNMHATSFKPRIETTTMVVPQTLPSEPIAEPTPEPEPTSEHRPDINTAFETYEHASSNNENENKDTEGPQPNPEPEPAPEPNIIATTTTTSEVPTTIEPQHTTQQNVPNFADVNKQFVYDNVILREQKTTTNNNNIEKNMELTTTEVPFENINEMEYASKSIFEFEKTTMTPLQQENNNEGTTPENGDEWLEDTTANQQTSNDETSNLQENGKNRATEERSSKAFNNDFNGDVEAHQPTTSTYNENEEINTNVDDVSFEQMTKSDEQPVTPAMGIDKTENMTTTAVSISQIFFGNNNVNKSLTDGILETTTMALLTGIGETRQSFDNVSSSFENNTIKDEIAVLGDLSPNSATPKYSTTTMSQENPNTDYSIAKQSEYENIDNNLNNKPSKSFDDAKMEPNITTEKDSTETDITFDVINKLYNRSSKTLQTQDISNANATEPNDFFREITETTTISDWLTESVAEVNYEDINNENKNHKTTEASVTRIDDIISREMNKDDYEPDYLNMASNVSKSVEHDEPLYGMLQDYDNDDSVIKRVKNEPGEMLEETTKNSVDIMVPKNEHEGNMIILKPTTNTDATFETTTVSQYIYKLSSTERNDIVTTSQPNTEKVTFAVPQVWENSEDDQNFNVKELPKTVENISQNIDSIMDSTSDEPTTVSALMQNSSKQDIGNTIDSTTVVGNATQGNNLNVTIYEISNHGANLSMEKSTNHQSTEYEDHETEMNPFLPEVENNKMLVKKLQEGHDIEPSNMNETQNENTDELIHQSPDKSILANKQKEESVTSKNQTEIQTTENTMTSMSNKNVTMENDTFSNELLLHRTTEETSSASAENNRDFETTQSPSEQLDDNTKEISDQSGTLPISTFLMDTDDLDTTKDPLDRSRESFNTNFDIPFSQGTSSNADIEKKLKVKDDNEFLSVVPIEQEKAQEKQNLKNSYDRENIPELNLISDSPKKSDRRTVDSSNTNSLIDNEA